MNAVTHFASGFAWTITPTRYSQIVRLIGINTWLATVLVTQALIVVLILSAIL